MEHELWLTALFNQFLARPANAILDAVGQSAVNREAPWHNWLVMEILVVVLLMIAAVTIRSALSAKEPGFIQHLFESLYGFLKTTATDVGMAHSEKYLPFCATLFFFILAMNLLGIVPTFESPTMFVWVPVGLAIPLFFYYNAVGIKANGFGYIKQFLGPIWWIAWLMLPIELISHLFRPLTLTVRLYGNMFAGEQLTLVFIDLTKIVIPVLFMALHVFVSFVQAFVFTILAMIYISFSTAHEH